MGASEESESVLPLLFSEKHRNVSMCRIRALAMGYSSSSKHWLNILVNSTTNSFIGSVSVAADLRFLKKDLFFINATRTTSVHSITHNHTLLHGNSHSNSSHTEETEKTPKPRVRMDTSRKKRAVDEAEDLAVLMEGETPEAKSKIIDMISTNFASGRFNDPVVSEKSNSWNARLGPKLGSMVQSLYSDLNAQSSAFQADDKNELDMSSTAVILLKQKIQYAEHKIARYEISLNKTNSEHEEALNKDEDVSQTQWKKSQIKRMLKFWKKSLENMKKEYDAKYIVGSPRAGRRLQAAVYLSPEWSEWTRWSKCSVDCGDGGFSVRRRDCLTLPAPTCPGTGFDMRPCRTRIKCQANFHEWGNWGPCSVTCGKGVRARSRVCVTGDREMKCKGPSTMLEKCTFPKCTQKPVVTAAPVKPVAPVLAAPSIAYILSPGIALGNNIYPVAQPAYGGQPASGQQPGEMVAVPEIGPQYHPRSFRAGGAAGFGAVAAGSVVAGAGAIAAGGVGAAKGSLSKVTVVETGDGGGPYVVTHHETESEEEQTVTPETILFIVLFLLCLLLLIIAFCIYFYQRTSDSNARKRLKEAKPFYKQDPGDDEDLDKLPAPGRVKPITRPGFGYLSELSMPKEPAIQMPPCVCPEEIMYPPVLPPLVGQGEMPLFENTVPPPSDQSMLAGEQVALDVGEQPEQGMALGEMNKSDEELEKKSSKHGKKPGGKKKSAEGKEIGGKRKSAEGKELGGKRKSAEGEELGGKRKSAEGKELGGKKESAEGKELGGEKKSLTEGESDQLLVAGQEASESKGAKKPQKTKGDKKKMNKKGKKGESASSSSLPSRSSSVENPAEGNVSASNISFDVTDQEEVDLRLVAQKRQRRASLRDHSAGDFLWQNGGLKHVSPLKRASNMKEQFLPTLHSTSRFGNPVVEGKHIWALPADQTQHFDNVSSKRKTVLNYSLLLPSFEQATPVGDTHVVVQGTYRSQDCERFDLDTEGKIKPYHETKRWNGKMRKFQYRKRTFKRAERKMNTYLKSVFRQKCKNMLFEKYKHCQFDVGIEKNVGGVNIRSFQKSSRIQSSESDTYPKDDSAISASSSFYSSQFSAAKAVSKGKEVQRFVNQAQAKKPDLGQESKPDSEMMILSCKTKGTLGNRKQTLSFDLHSRSSLHNRFPSSVYSGRRQRRGKFTSTSSSSWLSTLLSESDRKLNEIERDMDAVLKEQCRVSERNAISSSSQPTSGDTLRPSVIGVKDGDIFAGNQLGWTSAKMSSETNKFSPEDISLQGDTARKSEIKCLEESSSADSTQPMISEEPLKCDEDASMHAYEKKKEDILKLLHSTPLYQNRGQTMYYGDPWKILQPQVTGGDQAHQGSRLLNSNPKSEIENIKGRGDIYLMPGEHATFTNGASLTSQATSAVWTDQDSKGDFKTSSDTSNVPRSSTNQPTLTDSSENNMHTTCVSLPFTSDTLLDDMWQTERNKVLKTPEVSRSLLDDNYNPNDDTWRHTQKTTSGKSEGMVGITNQERVVLHKKPDVHGSINVYLQLQECPERAAERAACVDGKQAQQTVQGQNIRQPADCQIFLLNPQVKGQKSLDRHAGAPTCRSFVNNSDGIKEEIDVKINTSDKLTSAVGRSSGQDSTTACSYSDTPSHISGSTSMPTSVISSYQEDVFLQNNEKCTWDQIVPMSVRESQAGYEQILDKQLEQFVDSTSWISTKDHSKIHIEWNANKDSKRKLFDEMFQRSILPQDTLHFEAPSISSAVTSTRGPDSAQFLRISKNLTRSSGSTFPKRATYQETFQGESQEHQQCDRYNAVSAVQKQAWKMHEEKSGKVFAQNSYKSFPEVFGTSDRTVSVSGGDRTVSVSGDSTTVGDNSKWYSACSDVPKSVHNYRMSSDVPNTPDRKHGPANTCDSLASICDNYTTPESEISWETSRTNDSPCKSTYESPCKDECEFYTRNTSCNSSIPSLNRTFSLESASSCNNSAVCDTSANLPNLSEYHSLKTDHLTTSSSGNVSTEDISIFKEVISSYDNCSDSLVISDKELLSFPDSLTSRISVTDSSDFDWSRLELCHNQVCSSYTDSQSECLVSQKQQQMSNQTSVKCSFSDSVCKGNSNYDTISVSVQFSEGNEIMKTCYSKEEEEKHGGQPYQIHVHRLEMEQEYNKSVIQEPGSDGFDASPVMDLPHQLHELSVYRSSKELPLQGPFQTLPWSAENLVISSFSGKDDDPAALLDVQLPGDLSTPVDNPDDFDPWEARIDYMSFVNEADIVGSQRSLKQYTTFNIVSPQVKSLKQNTTFNIVSPQVKYSWTAETASRHPCSSESSVSLDKIHMSKCSETGHDAGQASQATFHLDQKHRSEEIKNIGSDLMGNVFPSAAIGPCQGFSSSSDRNADPYQNTTAAGCCMPSHEDSNSENDASKNKHSERKHKEHFVQEGKKAEGQTSFQTRQKCIDDWSTSVEGGNITPCGTDVDFQEFLCESVENDDSLSAKLELASVFYRRAIQWSPLFDGPTDNQACDTTTSVCPSWTVNPSAVIRETQRASSNSLRLDDSHNVQPKDSHHTGITNTSICPTRTLHPHTVIEQAQEVSGISLRLDESQEMQLSWASNPPTVRGQAQTSNSLRLGESHDLQLKNSHHTSTRTTSVCRTRTTSVCPSWTLNSSPVIEQAQKASSNSLRPDESKNMQPRWTPDLLAVVTQAQAAFSISLGLDESLQCQNSHHTSITTSNAWSGCTPNPPADIGHAQTALSISLRLDESHDMQLKNSHHRTKASRSKTPVDCTHQTPVECTHQTAVDSTHQTAVDSVSNCGYYRDFRNTITNKLEKSDPLEKSNLLEKSDPLENSNLLEKSDPLENSNLLEKSDPLEKSSPSYTMLVLKRGEYLSCEESCTAAVNIPDSAAYCCQNVLSRSTPQATSLLSGSAFKSSPTPKENLLMESDLRAGRMLIAETQQSAEMISSKLESGVKDSSMLSGGSREKQDNSESLAQESCSGFTTTDMRTRNGGSPDVVSKCDEGKKTQGHAFNLGPDLAAAVDDMLESDTISENMGCNGESSFPSSMNALVDFSSSGSHEHETGSSSLFSTRKLSSNVGSRGSLLCGVGLHNLTGSDTLSSSREFCSSCPHRSSSSTGYHGDNEYCQRQAPWKPTVKQGGVNISECEHCHTLSKKSVLFSSPESVHSSILDSSYHLDLSSDENSDDYTSKNISVSHCGSRDSNVHSKERESVSPSCSCSDEKDSYLPPSHTSADSSHKEKVCSRRDNTFGLFSSSSETDRYQPQVHDSHSCSLSSKSSLCVAENISSNSHSLYNGGRRSSASSVLENTRLNNFEILDQSVVNTSSPVSEIPHNLSWTKSLRIFDESLCSSYDYPSEVSFIDDCLSSSCMPRSSTFLGEPSVDDASCKDHPQDTFCRQELCRRQSCNQLQYENDCSLEFSDVINPSFDLAEPRLKPASCEHHPQTETFCRQELCNRQSCNQLEYENDCSLEFSEVMDLTFDTDEPELMSASCNHSPQIAASCVSELPRRHTSHHPELDLLCSNEYSEVTNQSFNTEEPELVLYNCGSQPGVNCTSSSQLLVRNNERERAVAVRDSFRRPKTRPIQGQHVEGQFVPDSPCESACSVSLEADEEALTTDASSSVDTSSPAGCASVETHGLTTASVSDLPQSGSTSHLCLVSKYVDSIESPNNVHPNREIARVGLRRIREGYKSKLSLRKDYASKLIWKSDSITDAYMNEESCHIPNLSDAYMNEDSCHIPNLSDAYMNEESCHIPNLSDAYMNEDSCHIPNLSDAYMNEDSCHIPNLSDEEFYSSPESQGDDHIRTSNMNLKSGHVPTLSGADVSGSSQSLMTMWSPLDCKIPAVFSSQFESSSPNLSLCTSIYPEQSYCSDSSRSTNSRGVRANAGTSADLSSICSDFLQLSPESRIHSPADSLPLTCICDVDQKITPRTCDCDNSRSETEV